jgi:hypothetical protein
MVAVLVSNQVCLCILFILPPSSNHMDSTPIYKLSIPNGELLEPPELSHPILTPGYELCPAFITMVREQTFSGEEDKNPYVHLREFEQLCSCLNISSMTHETLKWKLFLVSHSERAKQWYAHTIRTIKGEWDELHDKFYLAFFPISRIITLHLEILTFQEKEKETLGVA